MVPLGSSAAAHEAQRQEADGCDECADGKGEAVLGEGRLYGEELDHLPHDWRLMTSVVALPTPPGLERLHRGLTVAVRLDGRQGLRERDAFEYEVTLLDTLADLRGRATDRGEPDRDGGIRAHEERLDRVDDVKRYTAAAEDGAREDRIDGEVDLFEPERARGREGLEVAPVPQEQAARRPLEDGVVLRPITTAADATSLKS